MNSSSQDYIFIQGARVNNLKNVNCRIPRNKLTVITGISGSGKSSLAFDTIFAEGQRRYIQSMSSFARQFLGAVEKPDLDDIQGLSPALSIDQATTTRSPRSTVGTMSEIYDYLRLMFTHIGQPRCLYCQTKMVSFHSLRQEKPLQKPLLNDRSDGEWRCPRCGYRMNKLTMAHFSFNSPEGACSVCQGLGVRMEVDPNLVIPNTRLTINEGAIRPWQRMMTGYQWQKKKLEALRKKLGFSFNQPIKKFKPEVLRIIIFGDKKLDFEGIVPGMEKKYRETDSEYIRKEIEKYMVKKTCPACGGARLKKASLQIEVNHKNIYAYSRLSLEKLYTEINQLSHAHNRSKKSSLTKTERQVVGHLLDEMKKRIKFMLEVGLGYLTLERGADTLAGGEAQRIRLATQLGSGLMGVVYILDEPTIGLHARDQKRLLKALLTLRDLGNTVIVVEHEKMIIRAADYIIDIGPGAGERGGKIIYQGPLRGLAQAKRSLTAQYFKGIKKIGNRRRLTSKANHYLEIIGAQQFNLKNINVKIPLGRLVAIVGVSGSGKSTLIDYILVRKLRQYFFRARQTPGRHKKILGLDKINKVINITQAPIGRNVRSNPATYTGLLALLRDFYARQPLSIKRGYTPAQFSFNLKFGRCEYCRGEGVLKFEMHFLPNVYITCRACHGKRYNPQTLEVRYQGKTIADVLNMSVDEAYRFFKTEKLILNKLDILRRVGLGYIRLGQNAPDLSGGEAQRVKLATELSRASSGKTLYILDEPTSGLHFDDINRLLTVLSELVEKGNTVVVIEHNLDVIQTADWIIELGPEGGEKGGYLIAQGSLEQIIASKKSRTGAFLKN